MKPIQRTDIKIMTPKKPKNSNGRRRYKLWIQDPHCYWCGSELKWKKSTIDHLYSRVKNGKFKGKREKKAKDVENYTVLSCTSCNQKQQVKERLEMPRWHWWIRSRSFPRFSRKDLTMVERFVILWYRIRLDYKPERV